MADIFLKDKDGRCHTVLTVADGFGEAVVDGRTWRWEYHEYLGPLWLKADGCTPRECQHPTKKAVWDAFMKWQEEYKKAKKKC